jgi:hypothetical protein
VSRRQWDRDQLMPVDAGHGGPRQYEVLRAVARELGVQPAAFAGLDVTDANALAGGRQDGASLRAVLLLAEVALARRCEQDRHGHSEY